MNAEKILQRYRELESLAVESFFPAGGMQHNAMSRQYTEKDMQERIRTLALIRDVMEQNGQPQKEQNA